MYLVVLTIGVLIINVASESCYIQRCLGCRPEAAMMTGSSVECYPENWVSPEWVHNLGHPPPSTSSKVFLEYRCLKMIATPDDKTRNTVDVLKGCIPKVQVDSVCNALRSIQRARGHSDVRCYECRGNNCNNAHSTYINSMLLITPLLLMLYNVFR